MLAIVIPTLLATLGVAYWFRSSNRRARYRPDFIYSGRLEFLVWSIPALTVLLVCGVGLLGAHRYAYWFRSSNRRARYRPDFIYSGRLELLVWSIPAMTVLLVGGVAWIGAHELDPRKPIASDVEPLRVPGVSLEI